MSCIYSKMMIFDAPVNKIDFSKKQSHRISETYEGNDKNGDSPVLYNILVNSAYLTI